ncbi:helix-turn-helix domain-containing protein [Staphylococcus hominis]|uniref:helix-turn-helix domain-containing protein n=2 Tax=Staphylococcus hominis TaxID=1290 RepID=UPI000851C03F|nr:helix-turn-helix transcriptional regulator [Staphylococcus hominis]MBC3078868.1 helix-turn-helix transcriptional regulator [Staphylococcus hominis]MBS9539225.1 helix-turn-helix transcriptional regulator [Staphylococcus hominis subsp. novobiosepticus]MCI2895987.1 helix-turn-helix domain-containing protein [Staphylococcus hominis]MCI2904497.1 helix-turn-helix domain-containing protein [Staphylococcus hominis]MCI2906595.1 helix-turn-helix domain-containing protein [Staphylococcus hominis]
MNENNFELGSYLKSIRNEYDITTRNLGKKIGFSHSYISSVENNAKRNPSQDFIEKYLMGVTGNKTMDVNFFIENINKLSDNKFSFKTLDTVDDLFPYISNVVEKFVNQHIFTYKTKNKNNDKKISKDISFEIPINDINFHLTDIENFKFFGGIPLYETEKKEIIKLICNYLNSIYSHNLQLLKDLYNNNKISKESFEEEKEKFEDYLELLKRIQY